MGLAISQSLMLTGYLQWGIRQSADVANQMMSVERVLEYMETKPEPNLEIGKFFLRIIYRGYNFLKKLHVSILLLK